MKYFTPFTNKLVLIFCLMCSGFSHGQMVQLINQSGNLQVRGDACGTNTASCTVTIPKTVDATTVFKAYVYYSGLYNAGDLGPNNLSMSGPSLPLQVLNLGQVAASVPNPWQVYTRYEDVTALLGPGLNAAAPGSNLTYTLMEANAPATDGAGLIVVWNAPTVITSGIHVTIGSGAAGGAAVIVDTIYTAPINTAVPGFFAALGTGFVFSTGTGAQVSTVWVNNTVITTVGGGLDDGDAFANGALVTLGGTGDNLSWPTEDEFNDVAGLIPNGSTVFDYRIIGSADDWVNAIYFEITGATITLPVEMSSFTIDCNSDKNQLEWVTESEINNEKFIIQRSHNGYAFEDIGVVDGNGNSQTMNFYSFTDDAKNDKNTYYRIKQVDFNGESVLSDLVVSSCNTIENEVVVFPNPTDNSLQLEITTKEGIQDIVVTNILGNRVLNKKYNFETGFNQLSIDLSDLTPGVYFLNISGNGMTPYIEKVIKN